MTNRVPLIVDSANAKISELPTGDWIELDSSGVANANLSNVQILGGNAGQVIATDGAGNLIWVDQSGGGGGGGSSIANGSSSVSIPIFNGNIAITVAGNSRATVTGNAFIIPDLQSTVSNITTGNITDLSGANASIANVTANRIIPSGSTVTVLGNLTVTANINGTSPVTNINSINTLTANSGGFNSVLTGNLQTGNVTSTGAGINFNGKDLSNIALTPLALTSAASKNYVDLFVQGISVKTAANTATTTTLASSTGGTITYNNGTSGVGATLITSTSWGTIGGLAVTVGQRVLVKNQATSAHNGIYAVTNTTTLTRTTDADTPSKLNAGIFVFIEGGSLQTTGWVQVQQLTTIGTDPVDFNQFAGSGTYTASGGVVLNGTDFSLTPDQTFAGNVSAARFTTTGNISGANITASTRLNTANLTATGTVSLGNIANVDIMGGNVNQFIQTDGTGHLTFANAITTFSVIAGNGMNIGNGSGVSTNTLVTVNNRGMISQDGQTYDDWNNPVWLWDSSAGRGPWINYVNAASVNDTDFPGKGWTVCPAVNNSKGSILTQISNLSTYFNQFGKDMLFEAIVMNNGGADGISITVGSSTFGSASANITNSTHDAGGGITVGIDTFNYNFWIAKGGNRLVYQYTYDGGLRSSISGGFNSWKKFQVLVRYIDSNTTYVYLFWEDKILGYVNIGSYTPGGNNCFVTAYTGGVNAEFRCRRFTLRNGNFTKYLQLPNLEISRTFNSTGADQTFVVPTDVTEVNFTVRGGQGGTRLFAGQGGYGAQLEGILPVIPGETLTITVGGSPFVSTVGGYPDGGQGGVNTANNNSNGTGGGGSSGIYRGARSFANALVVAAGGGGTCGGGANGAFIGGNAVISTDAWYSVTAQWSGNPGLQRTAGSFGNIGGRGATMAANVYNGGGAAGVPFDTNSVNPTAGTSIVGGNGGNTNNAGHFGGGGGGGGYYGGGGGAAGGGAAASGGAGSSYSVVPFKVNRNSDFVTSVGVVTLRFRGTPR
jgi:hypothetical protein